MPFASGIHYTSHTDDTKHRPPLLLIHGAGGNHLTWHPYIRRMSGVTVYALDLPGHGQSEGVGRSSIEEYARDVLNFMDVLEIGKAIVAGLSMGSAITLTLALNHPGRLQGMILMGGGAKMRVAKSILETAGHAETFPSAVENINTNCFSAQASPDLVQLSRQAMLKMNPPALLGDFQACNQFDVTAQLSGIQRPTLIICGAEDVMTPPRFSQSLSDQIPNSRLHILEKTGHMVTLEQPELVVELLKQFMDDLPLQP
ncbi:MAG TPA: alpha/beta fold hydrolase [Anaerolineales bacterium]|nr:alpha/beta fold hydrolase [Anaerolineales bacterium]HNN13787.1 alpha/beta fold hydrolase [Anaerolineales bacterium]